MNQEHPEIPQGLYCYSASRGGNQGCTCPHWGISPLSATYKNGWCSLTGLKDWEDNTLLWDQVKACKFNLDPEV